MTVGTAASGVGSLYLYGFVLPGAEVPSGLTGISGRPVSAIPLTHVGALVSDAPADRDIGLPDDARDHTRVLDALADPGPVLPVVFGTTTTHTSLENAVPEREQRQYSGTLRNLAGTVQFTVTARYHEEAILAELVTQDPQVRRLRDLTRGRSEIATYDSRLRLGELVVAGFDRRRPLDAERVRAAVAPFARQVRIREVTETSAVADMAILAARGDQAVVENALEDLAAQVAGRMAVRLVGPQAPYDFVEEG